MQLIDNRTARIKNTRCHSDHGEKCHGHSKRTYNTRCPPEHGEKCHWHSKRTYRFNFKVENQLKNLIQQ